jgi:predicted DNA-binding transcriptional regulator AlpA
MRWPGCSGHSAARRANANLERTEKMSNPVLAGRAAPAKPLPAVVLLTPKEAAQVLKVSESWLAKARMRGDGPPFIKIGRSIRYSEAALIQWMKSQQRLSTSEQ